MPILQTGKLRHEKLRNLPLVTQLLSAVSGIQTQGDRGPYSAPVVRLQLWGDPIHFITFKEHLLTLLKEYKWIVIFSQREKEELIYEGI